ncbi:hypothetical protein CesoFtcFv8_014494 [Champsocephalus esox]|uniref:Uncharacterized protein n=2 Tax=Champsocephalus TaxID=52236 RepID=A0AAN8DB83_CHAGU|nr:hypothetical protein CesoFtcFv8_014494 [Champsocephalus esox]KAK5918905.1 hypothetical protein CgunFtcFv8_022846 [Champsocephalus gunnari]
MSREVSGRRVLQGPPLCLYLSTSSPNTTRSGGHKRRIDHSAGACVYGAALPTYCGMNDPAERSLRGSWGRASAPPGTWGRVTPCSVCAM